MSGIEFECSIHETKPLGVRDVSVFYTVCKDGTFLSNVNFECPVGGEVVNTSPPADIVDRLVAIGCSFSVLKPAFDTGEGPTVSEEDIENFRSRIA